MHYECELAVVIGRPARQRAARRRAMQHVAGYTSRQRLRDPRLPGELVPAQPAREEPRRRARCSAPGSSMPRDVADPPAAGAAHLRQRQAHAEGNTRDLIFDIPFLIEYLSGFMTLAPGDVILTGTPEGVVERRRRRRGGRARSTASAASSTRSSATMPSAADAPTRRRTHDMRIQHLIDGQAGRQAATTSRPSIRRRRTCSPKSPRGGAAEVDAAVAAAKAAFPAWAARRRPSGRALMRRLGDLIAAARARARADRDARHRPGDRADAASSSCRARPTTSTTSPRCARASTATPTRRRRTSTTRCSTRSASAR